MIFWTTAPRIHTPHAVCDILEVIVPKCNISLHELSKNEYNRSDQGPSAMSVRAQSHMRKEPQLYQFFSSLFCTFPTRPQWLCGIYISGGIHMVFFKLHWFLYFYVNCHSRLHCSLMLHSWGDHHPLSFFFLITKGNISMKWCLLSSSPFPLPLLFTFPAYLSYQFLALIYLFSFEHH